MNRYKRNNGALISALGVVTALTITAAIGLMAATQYAALPAPAMSVSCKGALSEPAAAMPLDPELMRTDRANEHHG
jgi:hypothetical protein